MDVLMFRLRLAHLSAAAGFALVVAIPASAVAQTVATPAVSPSVPASASEVPDGSPQLAQDRVISNASTGVSGAATPGRSAGSVIANEERIQGRLAISHVNVGGGRSYTVVDPNAGRADRQTDHGGKRLSPSLWELFRF
jgi:hypothetical protein